MDEAASFRDRLVQTIPHIRAFAFSLCRNRSDAEDLTQDTLMRAWRAKDSFQPETNIRAWLFTIMRNAFYTRKHREGLFTKMQAERFDQVAIAEGAQHHAAELWDVVRAIQFLNPEQREAIILVAAAGFSLDEAAAICGCATGTIKSRLSRARQSLVKRLEQKTLAIEAAPQEQDATVRSSSPADQAATASR